MGRISRPHLLGIDDGPFEKGQQGKVPIVGVMMECGDLCEAVALTEFPIDGANATEFLTEWIEGLRFRPTLQGIVLGGITIAGLGVVDIRALARKLEVPVIVVTRRDPTNHRLHEALEATGLSERLTIVERTPPAFEAEPGLYVAHAGVERDGAQALVRATVRKAKFPEPLRVAHLIARAVVSGESRGRV
jgi:endonuclease V-like protein UPF0215 family